jgi:cobalt-zinc-cadmium resistance protein CzcA
MYRGLLLLLFTTLLYNGNGQRLVTRSEALDLAVKNQRNLRAANLSVQQQQELLKGSTGLESPQVFGELTPYEPLILGVQQTLSLPSVYRNRRALQREQMRLAQLRLQGSQYDLKRDVSSNYLQLQYLAHRRRLVLFQDSIYNEIKAAAKRFFAAGQINKLEELQASSQADQVSNELSRTEADYVAELELFRFYTYVNDSIVVDSLSNYAFLLSTDSAITNIQQQLLFQQIAIQERELQLQRSQLLPELQAGVSFPTSKEFERPVGFQFGITIPIWQRQNRSRIAAARTGIEVAKAQQELESQRLNAQYRQTLNQYRRDLQSLTYFNSTALPQARAIMETSRRLFQGGELNYIESLRNLQSAFDIFFSHLDTHRAFNESVIQLKYLNGTL